MAQFLRLTASELTLQMKLAKSSSLGTHMAQWWNRGHCSRDTWWEGWGTKIEGMEKE